MKRVSVASLLVLSLTLPAAAPMHVFAEENPGAASLQEAAVLKKVQIPEDAGFSSAGLKKVDQMIEKDISRGFPGAALVVIKDGMIVKEETYGYSKVYNGTNRLNQPERIKKNTLFDLASNTKMYAVNFALQHLVTEGKIHLEDRVQTYIPEFRDMESDSIKGKDSLRIIDILHHTAGFPADPQYHNPKVSKNLYSQDRETTIQMISRTPLSYKPGTKNVYSDVDYMLLGAIIEKVTGMKLDEYVENHMYKPLGLTRTVYNPLKKGFSKKDAAATERMGNTREGTITFPNIRSYTLQGEVHDEKAFYSMEGVSGHAGLFSTTGDMAVLLQTMLNGGSYGQTKLFSKETANSFVQPSALNPTYGLGWRLNGNDSMEWMFGPFASGKAFGHTGWTGTVTILDPEYDLGIVLLTNKKHTPMVKNSASFQGDLYQTGKYGSIVTAVYEAMLKEEE